MRRFRFLLLFAPFYILKCLRFSLVGGIISGIGSAVSGAFNYASQSKANRINNYWSKKNYEMQQQQLQYQKYLNNNQIQIQSADAQKAGINPMAMNSSTLSSGNYSNVDSNQQAPQLDLSGLIQAAISEDSNRNQKNIADNANSTSKSISESNNKTQENIADAKNKSAENIEQIRQNGETARQQAQLVAEAEEREKDRQNAKGISDSNNASNEKVSSNNLAETKRHNEAMEKVEDFKTITDRNYKEALVKMQRAVNEAKISLEWSDDARKNQQILMQKQQLDKQLEYLEKEISQKNWDRVNMIWKNLIDTGKTVSSFLAPIKIQK